MSQVHNIWLDFYKNLVFTLNLPKIHGNFIFGQITQSQILGFFLLQIASILKYVKYYWSYGIYFCSVAHYLVN